MTELHGEYVSAMFVFLKSSLLFEPNNPAMIDACDKLAEVTNSIWNGENGQAELRFRYDGIYVNQQYLTPPSDKIDHCEYVGGVWRSLNVAALSPSQPTKREQWLELATALRRFVRGESALPRMSDVIVQGLPLHAPRPEDGDAASDERWQLFQAYFFAVAALRYLWGRPAGRGSAAGGGQAAPGQAGRLRRPLARPAPGTRLRLGTG